MESVAKAPQGPAKAPCKSCPYRKDVPSGVWAKEEYAKLPTYDGDIMDQVLNGGHGMFMCHQQDGKLCAGWLGCHGASNLLAFRLTRLEIDPKVDNYTSPVPLFRSGAAAAKHGMRAINRPAKRARDMVAQLTRKQKRTKS